ncbi:MAG TPA: ferritin family protein [Candidatus Binatia bacterium]|nr:ferritin family protein [Candidatus Binatia bacterium]
MTEKNLAEHAISARSRTNLLEAMRGEAFASAKYKLFARHARANGDTELADLFDKTADQEYMEHFTEQADLLELVGSDEQDVTDAIAGESFEVDTLYKRFAEEAREDGDEQVAHRFEEIRRDEAFHQLAFQEALIKLQTLQRTLKGATRRSAKAHDF